MGYAVPYVAGPFNQLLQIFQAPGYVAIFDEGTLRLILDRDVSLHTGRRAALRSGLS